MGSKYKIPSLDQQAKDRAKMNRMIKDQEEKNDPNKGSKRITFEKIKGAFSLDKKPSNQDYIDAMPKSSKGFNEKVTKDIARKKNIKPVVAIKSAWQDKKSNAVMKLREKAKKDPLLINENDITRWVSEKMKVWEKNNPKP